MKNYDTQNLQLLNRGGEADIYEWQNDRILRVLREYRRGGDAFEKDKYVFSLLAEHKISVPKVYEYCTADKNPAVIMQKINGVELTDILKKNIFRLSKETEALVHMQLQIAEIDAAYPLNSVKQIVAYFMQSPMVTTQQADFVNKLLDDLPDGNKLCHGDFHPGNILVQNGQKYIIDWGGAHRGCFLSDAAHTYLLMKHVPQIPGQSAMQHTLLQVAGAMLARAYLKAARRSGAFQEEQFAKWTVVMAFLRVHYGLPGERTGRLKYIEKCAAAYHAGVPAEKWYRL